MLEANIIFDAFEYGDSENFTKTYYQYSGSEENGWKIYRNEHCIETLGSGYIALKTLACGICSTDLARVRLPFPLPQITGHEVVALYENRPVVVEINASHKARGCEDADCWFCKNSLSNHCPDRLTLGIDRLPGGFSPFILAPKNSIVPLPNELQTDEATLVEPFAAALHAVKNEDIVSAKAIAVVGVKRLGGLLILALKLMRLELRVDFKIAAVIRNSNMRDFCYAAGADFVVLVNELGAEQYDIVFDTSGSVSGIETALKISKSTLHVKSTHGLSVCGFSELTALVINEGRLMSFKHFNDKVNSIIDKNINSVLLIDSSLPENVQKNIIDCMKDAKYVIANIQNLDSKIKYHMAVISGVEGLNIALQSQVIMPKGAVFLYDSKPQFSSNNFLENALHQKNIQIHTSRCGDFSEALILLSHHYSIFKHFAQKFITHHFGIKDLNQAFKLARTDKKSIKIVVNHEVET